MYEVLSCMDNPNKAIRDIFTATLVAAAADILASWLLARVEMSQNIRILVAILPIPCNAILVAILVRAIRRLDAFQQRLHFEAVALAFVSTGLAVLMYGYLQKAHVVGPLNVGLVWALMSIFYALGYGIAARHYR